MDNLKILLEEYEDLLSLFMAAKKAMMLTAEFKLEINRQALEKMFDGVDAKILTATIKSEPLIESIIKDYFTNEIERKDKNV